MGRGGMRSPQWPEEGRGTGQTRAQIPTLPFHKTCDFGQFIEARQGKAGQVICGDCRRGRLRGVSSRTQHP